MLKISSKTVLFIILTLPIVTSAQSGKLSAMGNAGTAFTFDTGFSQNSATQDSYQKRSVSLQAQKKYGLSELQGAGLVYSQRTKKLNIGVLAESFGYASFRRNLLGLNLAKSLKLGSSRKFNIGLGAKLYQVQAEGYESKTAIGISAGWSTPLTDKTNIAFNAQNFSRPKFQDDEELERSIALGLQYKPTQVPAIFLIDLVKDVRFPLSLRTGLEVKPVNALSLRAGATTAPATYSVGAGFMAGKIMADFAAQHHETLGWSPNLSISIGF